MQSEQEIRAGIRKQRIKNYKSDYGALQANRRALSRLRRGKGAAKNPLLNKKAEEARLRSEILEYKTRSRGNLEEAIKHGAGKGNQKKDLKVGYKSGGKAPAVSDPPSTGGDGKVPPRQYRSYSSAPSVKSRKKANSRPPSVKQQARSAKEDKKRYLALQKNRTAQSAANYEAKTAGTDYKSGQKKYKAQTKEIKKSRYSWASHKAAMKRRGKKASQESYAKFKRYNGI
jgi:hypothetical protein